MALSRKGLSNFTRRSADPAGYGPYVNRTENVGLTDSELVRRIEERNALGKPTYKLRREYERRLERRGE